MNFRELSNEQRRQTIDIRQVFETYLKAKHQWDHSYSGSMRWVERKGHFYLHHKRKNTERSLGPKNGETEHKYYSFLEGRQKLQLELNRLSSRLDEMAPVNRALGLGRVPQIAAKILRRLDQEELLGQHLLVAGTYALYAFEAKCGLHFSSDLLATNDADFLWDTRQKLELLKSSVRISGIKGLLQKVDQSFEVRDQGDFRASNADGFAVDLIRPEDPEFVRGSVRQTIGENSDDLHGAPIYGLHWLLSAPRFEEVVIGEDGFPARIVTFDPRFFVIHKLWISQQQGRETIKKQRDRSQAQTVKSIVGKYLNLDFHSNELKALPKELVKLLDEVSGDVENRPGIKIDPDW